MASQYPKNARSLGCVRAFLGMIFVLSALAAVAQPEFVLHSISRTDELAVISWPGHPMIAVAPGMVVNKQWAVSNIMDDKVILENENSGDQLILDKSGLKQITKKLQKERSPTPVRPSS